MGELQNLTFKEVKEKIRLQKEKITNLENTYRAKLSALKSERDKIKSRQSMASSLSFTSKGAAKAQEYMRELDKANEQLELIQEEMQRKLSDEKSKLRTMEKYFSENLSALKNRDKKERNVRRAYNKENRKDIGKWVFIWVAAMAFFVIVSIPGVIQSEERKAQEAEKEALIRQEEERDYYIAIDDEVSFDCIIDEKRTHGVYLYCQEENLLGTFSNYETVTFNGDELFDIDGNDFVYKLKAEQLPYTLYRTNDFDISTMDRWFPKNITLELQNKVLNKVVAKKDIKVFYKLSEDDMPLIQQKHNEWVIEEENSRKRREEQEQKNKEEEERKKAGEEQKKKEEAQSSSNPSTSPSSGQSPSSSNTSGLRSCMTRGGKTIMNCSIDKSDGSSFWGTGTITGRVQNVSGENYSYVQINLGIYNSSGSKVGDCYDMTGTLRNGDTWSYSATCTAWAEGGQVKFIDLTYF